MRKSIVSGLAAILCAGYLASGAGATGTLDQQQLSGGSNAAISTAASFAQVVTPGLSGALDQADLSLRGSGACCPTAPLTVEIRNAVAGAPGDSVLATQSVPATSVTAVFAFVPVAFAAPATVTAGTQFAIVAYSSTDPGSPWSWETTLPGNSPYAGGSQFFTVNSPPMGAWTEAGPPPGQDNVFKTYVTPPTPPASAPTGQRAAALKKCAKIKSKKKKKKCKKRARKLPV